MFGDYEWASSRTDEQYSRVNKYVENHFTDDVSKTVIIEMGAGTGIPSIRNFWRKTSAEWRSLNSINPRKSQGPRGTISIPMGAKATLEGIDQIIMEKQQKLQV